MTHEGLVSLILSIPLGIISGLYAGLIVARYQRFSDLRSRVLWLIREIDFMQEGSRMTFPKRKETPELLLISSDFRFLRHTQAADESLQLLKEIDESIYGASKGTLDYETFERRYSEWQDRGRNLGPNLFWILRLWGGL